LSQNDNVIPNLFRNLKINTMKRGMLKQIQHDNVEEIRYIEHYFKDCWRVQGKSGQYVLE